MNDSDDQYRRKAAESLGKQERLKVSRRNVARSLSKVEELAVIFHRG